MPWQYYWVAISYSHMYRGIKDCSKETVYTWTRRRANQGTATLSGREIDSFIRRTDVPPQRHFPCDSAPVGLPSLLPSSVMTSYIRAGYSETRDLCRGTHLPGRSKTGVPLLYWAIRQEEIWESGCIDPSFLDLGTSSRWAVSFTPLPLYPRGKCARYPLERRLGGTQSPSGRFGEVKILDPSENRTPTFRYRMDVRKPNK
jgi:hypothetical protein